LGYRGFVGEQLRYVATYRDQWIALLGWSAASLKNTHRDRWIGWSNELQYKRLNYLTNNSRYLILPGVRKKNLASRVLSLNLKRLSQDWMRRYGHPILLVETFVDGSRYKGICYKAAGWLELGETKGYGRDRGKYYHHGLKKRVFVRPLHRMACEVLSAEAPSPLLQGNRAMNSIDINKLPPGRLQSLKDKLSQISDQRKRRGLRHPLPFLLLVSVCSVLSGCRSYKAMGEWVAGLSQEMLKRLGCRYNYSVGRYVPPNEITLRRLIQDMDAAEVDRVIGEWLGEMVDDPCIAVDGKRLRGASYGAAQSVHLLAAVTHGKGMVLRQEQVSEKSNEIPFFQNY